MKRLIKGAGALALAVIPCTALLLLWELVTLPRDAMGMFVFAYLSLVLAILTWELVRDAWRWLKGERNQ